MSRFWEDKPLDALTRQQWEALCDGCGKCCLHKLEDADTGAIFYSQVACRLLDRKTARCSDYTDRKRRVPDCAILSPDNIAALSWMPSTCAYRLRAEGKPLPDWHPLVSGRAASVAEAGHSVAGRVIDERSAGAIEHHLIDWAL